jgi:hypothetical protein
MKKRFYKETSMRRITRVHGKANGSGLKGKRFGELVVLRPSRSGRAGAWVAQCDCGKLALVYDYLLKSGETTSCGCGEGNKTHTAPSPQ